MVYIAVIKKVFTWKNRYIILPYDIIMYSAADVFDLGENLLNPNEPLSLDNPPKDFQYVLGDLSGPLFGFDHQQPEDISLFRILPCGGKIPVPWWYDYDRDYFWVRLPCDMHHYDFLPDSSFPKPMFHQIVVIRGGKVILRIANNQIVTSMLIKACKNCASYPSSYIGHGKKSMQFATSKESLPVEVESGHFYCPNCFRDLTLLGEKISTQYKKD